MQEEVIEPKSQHEIIIPVSDRIIMKYRFYTLKSKHTTGCCLKMSTTEFFNASSMFSGPKLT